MMVPRSLYSLFAMGLLLAGACAPAAALERGSAPPAMLGTTIDARPLYTTDYAGRILVVTFWASWCGPCLNEMRALERLQREAGERLAVVSINIESAGRFRVVQAAQSQRLHLRLTHDTDGSARRAWGVGPIPHLFMIDHEGRVAYEHRGYGDDFIPTLVDHVNDLLRRQALVQAASTP